MRLIFGVLSLVIALAVAGLLAKTQLTMKPPARVSAVGGQPNSPVLPDGAETRPPIPHQKIQTIQDQVRQSVDASMQRSRPSEGE